MQKMQAQRSTRKSNVFNMSKVEKYTITIQIPAFAVSIDDAYEHAKRLAKSLGVKIDVIDVKKIIEKGGEKNGR
ncbi:MAG TPA: hypothetical protein VE090_02590 [Methylomirabilota bacterium]|nr:hypothetical protein [Methylomirabilota bacterium]